MTDPGDDPEKSESKGERRRSVALFFATFACVYLVYGFQWTGGDPLSEPDAAWAALQFSVALMAILLSHEMAHYWVAKAHGFSLSLPYFLPFPAAFGTFGAIIRLRSLPKTRSGLLEMGAAGPLAGFAVAVVAIGRRGTQPLRGGSADPLSSGCRATRALPAKGTSFHRGGRWATALARSRASTQTRRRPPGRPATPPLLVHAPAVQLQASACAAQGCPP